MHVIDLLYAILRELVFMRSVFRNLAVIYTHL